MADSSSSSMRAAALGAAAGATVAGVLSWFLFGQQQQHKQKQHKPKNPKSLSLTLPTGGGQVSVASGTQSGKGGCKRANLVRKSFVMGVYADCHKEYKKRHSPIWPELEQCLFDHGVHTYSIFLHASTNQLFGYLECESSEKLAEVANTAVCKKWWAHMKELMPNNKDGSPTSTDITEVFHIEK